MTMHNAKQIEATTSPQILVERESFTHAIETVCETVERKNKTPILLNVAIHGHGTHMTATATDLELEISVSIPVAADSRFKTTIPAHMLKDLLKKARKSEYAGLIMGEGTALIDLEKSKYKLQSLPIDEFPELAGPDSNAATFTLSGEQFHELLSSVQGAISNEETRYYLNGIYMHVAGEHPGDEGKLIAVATDGRRLARKRISMPDGAESMAGVIIPKKMIYKILKLTKGKKCPETVSISVSETRIRVQFENVTITSKLIDGSFPDYHRVIPENNELLARMDAKELTACVNDACLVSSDRGLAVKLTMEKSFCRFEVNNSESGSSLAKMAIESNIEALETGFNSVYLRDAMAWIGEGTARFEFRDYESPVRVTGSREGFDVTLMPMRV